MARWTPSTGRGMLVGWLAGWLTGNVVKRVGKSWIPHILALGMVALGAFALPGNLKVMELRWLREQAALWFCGPTAGGLQSDWIKTLTLRPTKS